MTSRSEWKDLGIVILGEPEILRVKSKRHWKKFIKHCRKVGLKPGDEITVQILKHFKKDEKNESKI